MRPARLAPAAARAGATLLLVLAASAPVARPLHAQPAPGPPADGATIRVSVLTIGPGSAVFERFGHNALRITDTATGSDLAYNWGMFSFADPNFLGRFLSGDTRYWVEAFPSTRLIEAYIRDDREVVEQELALTAEQRAALAGFARRNALPENRYYRYDYFRDNCSTRVRDALDAVLGGSLERRFTVMTTPWTYRSESVRLTTPDAFAQTGIELALGPRADVPMTAWQAMFIPMRLRDYLRDVTVPGADGVPVPRVRDALDAVLGGSLERRFTVMTTPWTYRSESVRLTTPDALAQTGIELALGPRADVPMTAWQAMFIPMRLRDYLRDVTVPGADGVPVPLVRSEQVHYRAARAPEPPERRGLTLGAWGPILGVWMLLLAPFGAVRRERTRVPAAVMAAVWYTVTGLVGLLIAAMWVGSAHVFWYDNLNLLLVSPVGLVAAAPVARAILRGRAGTLARVSVLLILLQVVLAVPMALLGPQRLAGPLLLLLPAHLGLVLAIWRHTRDGTAAAAATA